jgi:hypothetical protein
MLVTSTLVSILLNRLGFGKLHSARLLPLIHILGLGTSVNHSCIKYYRKMFKGTGHYEKGLFRSNFKLACSFSDSAMCSLRIDSIQVCFNLSFKY